MKKTDISAAILFFKAKAGGDYTSPPACSHFTVLWFFLLAFFSLSISDASDTFLSAAFLMQQPVLLHRFSA